MPTLLGYFGCELDALVLVTGTEVAVHIRDGLTTHALCDVRFTRAELAALLEQMDDVAAVVAGANPGAVATTGPAVATNTGGGAHGTEAEAAVRTR